jgi:hypothetical protein
VTINGKGFPKWLWPSLGSAVLGVLATLSFSYFKASASFITEEDLDAVLRQHSARAHPGAVSRQEYSDDLQQIRDDIREIRVDVKTLLSQR